MTIYRSIIDALWFCFVAYWVISAASAKRTLGTQARWIRLAFRVGIVGLVVLALRIRGVNTLLRNVESEEAGNTLLGLAGVVLCAAGMGLAVAARIHIGRNWGMPMSRKENPELVTTGPYSAIRHPIYTGILVAMLGSSIGVSAFWAIPLVWFAAYFVYSARREERLMLDAFPEQYAAYMKRTKMLLPFIL